MKRKLNILLIFFITILFIFVGCGNQQEKNFKIRFCSSY